MCGVNVEKEKKL